MGYHSHFTDGEVEAQRGHQERLTARLRFPWSKPCALNSPVEILNCAAS